MNNPAVAPPLVTKRGPRLALGDLVAHSLELPTVPSVAAKVIRALDDTDITARDIARMIQTDQGITARIIKTSNSSFYGLSRKITSLQSAVALLGLVQVRDLVIASSTRYLYRRFGPVEKQIWTHSVAMALCTRMLATHLAPRFTEAAYLAGQMHDVGKVVMVNADPKRFAQAAALVKEHGSWEAEQRVFGYTHADVGALLASKWQMPPEIEAVCFYHHDFTMSRSMEPQHGALIACVVLANAMCHRLGLGDDTSVAASGADEGDAIALLETSHSRLERLTLEFDANFREEPPF